MATKGFYGLITTALVATFALGAPCAYAEDKIKKAKSKGMERSFKQKVMNEIPYSEDIKHMWDVVDGDINLHFTGLRADRRNKGVKYKTEILPLIGSVDGMEFEFKMGTDEQAFSFQSDKMPLVGDIKGFSYAATMGSDDNKISMRYKIALD